MVDLSIKDVSKLVHNLAKEKNLGTKPEEINTLEKIALIHSEVSELLEAFRDNNMTGKDGFSEEIADILIRVLHLALIHGVDVEKEILNKIKINSDRNWEDKKETFVKNNK